MGQQYLFFKTDIFYCLFFSQPMGNGRHLFLSLDVWFRNRQTHTHTQKKATDIFVFTDCHQSFLLFSSSGIPVFLFAGIMLLFTIEQKTKRLSILHTKNIAAAKGGGNILISLRAGFPSFRMPSIQVPLPKHAIRVLFCFLRETCDAFRILKLLFVDKMADFRQFVGFNLKLSAIIERF